MLLSTPLTLGYLIPKIFLSIGAKNFGERKSTIFIFCFLFVAELHEPLPAFYENAPKRVTLRGAERSAVKRKEFSECQECGVFLLHRLNAHNYNRHIVKPLARCPCFGKKHIRVVLQIRLRLVVQNLYEPCRLFIGVGYSV